MMLQRLAELSSIWYQRTTPTLASKWGRMMHERSKSRNNAECNYFWYLYVVHHCAYTMQFISICRAWGYVSACFTVDKLFAILQTKIKIKDVLIRIFPRCRFVLLFWGAHRRCSHHLPACTTHAMRMSWTHPWVRGRLKHWFRQNFCAQFQNTC